MTAIWTTPRTWVDGELVTAALTNGALRDNLDYLKARPVARVSDLDGTVSNTTSTSFVDITGASVSITTSGSSRLLVLASGTWAPANAGGPSYMTVLIDGVNQGDATNGLLYAASTTTNNPFVIAMLTAAAVSDGAHTVKLQYRTNTAVTTTVATFNLTVLEVF
jgi:hypothetical protein